VKEFTLKQYWRCVVGEIENIGKICTR